MFPPRGRTAACRRRERILAMRTARPSIPSARHAMPGRARRTRSWKRRSSRSKRRPSTRSGCALFIANGKRPNVLNDIFKTKDKTIFYPVKETDELSTKKRWIAYATTIIGKLKVNAGAKKAVLEKESSLLPIGVTKVINTFKKGDIVSIIDEDGNEFARGIINYSSDDVEKIIGHHSDDILKILGYKNYDAVITRDHIVIL